MHLKIKIKKKKKNSFAQRHLFKFQVAELKSHKCYCSFSDNSLQCQLEKIIYTLISCQPQLKKRFWKSTVVPWFSLCSLTYSQVQKTLMSEGKTSIYTKIPTSCHGKSRAVCFRTLTYLSSQWQNRMLCTIKCSECECSRRKYFISRSHLSPRKKSQFMIHIQRAKVRQDWATSSASLYHRKVYLRSLHLSCHSTQK